VNRVDAELVHDISKHEAIEMMHTLMQHIGTKTGALGREDLRAPITVMAHAQIKGMIIALEMMLSPTERVLYDAALEIHIETAKRIMKEYPK
jgi:hypothetical protein